MTLRHSRRIVRAAWIMARAFTPHAVLAPFVVPWTFCSVIAGALRRGLFVDDSRTGVVMLYRSNPVLDVLAMLPFMMLMFLGYLAAVPALLVLVLPLGWVPAVFSVVTSAFLAGLLFLLPRGGGSMFPWGPETPKGARWEVAGLAQLPGTRLTAIQLALRVIDKVPPTGAVVVATANSDKLYRQYQRFGFTGGPKHRVHKVIA